ncbi:MAG: DUF1592 domain-containing protein [Proteobacteria bacterium]|nr:DUF1592 domain-containing protein [Pseudomonadota bacterium]
MWWMLLACNDAPLDTGERTNGPVPDVSAGAPTLRRLTTSQYENAIADLFGDGLILPSSLEPDTQSEGLLSVGAGVASTSPWGVERYEDAAIDLAEQVVERGLELPCEPASSGDSACAEEIVDELGLRIWRRPLTEGEIERLGGVIAWIGGDAGDFDVGLTYGLAAMLQSPNFLYRREHGTSADGGPLMDHELATRLSFFLWNTIPDDELLAVAQAGELSTDAGLAEQADRMMSDGRASQGIRNLFIELYTLYELDDLDKDPLVFTHTSSDLGPAAREETLLLVENHLLVEGGDYRELFSTRRTWIDPRLAALYQVRAPDPDGFGEHTFTSDDGRRGLLGHASILAQYSHATSSSATLRGKFIRSTVLCHEIPAPPGDVDTTIPEADDSSPTLRDRIAIHLEDPTCAACHELLDPIGLGLENFDGIGRWRSTENGATIDASGDLDGVAFDDAWALSGKVAEHPDLAGCFTDHVYHYAVGRGTAAGERDLADWLTVEFELAGHAVPDLMRSTVMSPGFRNAGAFDTDPGE